MKSIGTIFQSMIVALAVLGGSILIGGATAFAFDFGTGPEHAVHIEEARGYPFCEILFIHGKPPEIEASVYNTRGYRIVGTITKAVTKKSKGISSSLTIGFSL